MVHVRVYRAVHFHANADSSLLVGRESGRHRAVMDLRTGFHVARRSDQLRAHRPFAADTADPDPRRLLTLRTSMPPRARLRHIPGHALPIDPPSPPARPRRRRASRPHRQRTQGTGHRRSSGHGRRTAGSSRGRRTGQRAQHAQPGPSPPHHTRSELCSTAVFRDAQSWISQALCGNQWGRSSSASAGKNTGRVRRRSPSRWTLTIKPREYEQGTPALM